MNVNSKPKAPTISEWLAQAATQLINTPTARLDAEVLLAHTLSVNRAWLHAHPDDPLQGPSLTQSDTLLKRRLGREPIAYITGHKEFYGREFIVTPDVLIPRPESETMIELLETLQLPTDARAIDVGTGSGCLGITAKLELPGLDVTLIDISPTALQIARQNADRLGADVTLIQSDLLSSFKPRSTSFDIVLANLPYVDPSWKRSPETDHEPALALFAEDHGLHLIKRLISQTPRLLASGGYILLEADPEQHAVIIQLGIINGLLLQTVRDYTVVLKR